MVMSVLANQYPMDIPPHVTNNQNTMSRDAAIQGTFLDIFFTGAIIPEER